MYAINFPTDIPTYQKIILELIEENYISPILLQNFIVEANSISEDEYIHRSHQIYDIYQSAQQKLSAFIVATNILFRQNKAESKKNHKIIMEMFYKRNIAILQQQIDRLEESKAQIFEFPTNKKTAGM